MEEHISQLTHWVNHLFAPLALRLLHALHIQPADFERPIPEYVVMSFLVLLIGTVLALLVRSRLSVERPGALQQSAELLLTNPLGFGIKDLLEENTGHYADKFIAFTGSVSIFILLANLLSIFPAFTSPTGNAVVPLACAILTVEIISPSARLLSLTVRLWANIFASDLIYVIFLGLLVGPVQWAWAKSAVLGMFLAIFPVVIPIAFIGLHIFVSIIQAYIFTVLPSIYIGGAIAEEH